MAAGPSPALTWPFAAREEEVAVLDELLLSGRGAVIAGDAGVGKSRLLSTIGDHAEAMGWTVHRVAASRALAAVPFGAFAAVLSASMSRGTGDRFSILHDALSELAGIQGAPAIITIDDAHQLDEGGAALALLAARSGLVVMTTVRRSEPCPDGITALWKDDLATRIDLAPLEGVDVGVVLDAVLGGPVDAGTRRHLVAKTGGNLLFLRELVRVGLARGALVERGNVWMWDGPITDAPAVADLLSGRLAALDASERRVVDVVALSEPIGVSLLDALCDPVAVRSCEGNGIVVTRRSGRRLDARLEHPLYADVVRDAMSPVTLTALAGEVAGALLDTGARRVGDRLRAASLLLAAAAPADVELLLAASAEARALADLDLAERLGRAAVTAGGGVRATVDLVETLHWQGEHGEVIALIDGADLASAPADFAANGAMVMAQSLFWGRGDLERALPWIAKGIEWGGPSWEGILRGKQALMLNNAGRTVDAITEGYAVIRLADASPVARLAGYSGLLPSLAVAGRLTELDEHLPLAQALIAEEPPGFSDVADGTLVATFIGGLFEGRLPEIDPMLEVFDEDALQRVDDPYRGMWAFLRGRSALAQGRLGVALPLLREAAAVLRRRDLGGVLAWCLAALGQAHGATGDAQRAAAAMAECDRVHLPVMRMIDAEIGLGHAWAKTAAGERTEGSERACAIADVLAARGDAATAVMALHDAARIGAQARSLISAVEVLAGRAEGPVVAAMARHIQGLADNDLDTLMEVAEAFAAVSLPLLAAEAAAGASRVASARGLRVRQREATSRAATLLMECGPALTPLIETIAGRAALAALTRREQEVALMAARGTSKRAMSEQLGVSIRTVGNHINHVYGKLGISTREELADLLSLPS